MHLVVTSRADWPLKFSLLATEDTPLRRGAGRDSGKPDL